MCETHPPKYTYTRLPSTHLYSCLYLCHNTGWLLRAVDCRRRRRLRRLHQSLRVYGSIIFLLSARTLLLAGTHLDVDR